MEWLMINPQVHGSFASLGSQVGDTYIASPKCLDILHEIIQKMSIEDRTLRTLRRAIGFSQVVKRDLMPLLFNIKDDRQITDTTIKVLADLTTPIECLLPIEVMSKSEAGRNTIVELNWLLISCKEAFLDPRGTKRIIDHIKYILYKEFHFIPCEELSSEVQGNQSSHPQNTDYCQTQMLSRIIMIPVINHHNEIPLSAEMNINSVPTPGVVKLSKEAIQNLLLGLVGRVTLEVEGDKLDESDCDTLNDCVILLRNILHIPDSMLNMPEGFSEQNQILWNLFAHSFDKLLIEMVIGPRGKKWRIAIAQLVVLLYKDQRVATLQKLLNLWMESSEWSESSEDNESNTSPPEGDSCSSMATSDPTSDSSDNSGCDMKPEIKIIGKRKQFVKQQNVIKSPDEMQCSQTSMWSSEGEQKMDFSSSKTSDCGYGTQAENQESFLSTSSNEDDSLNRNVKPVHQKPTNMIQKSRYTNGKVPLTTMEKEELRRKKLTRRFNSNIASIQASDVYYRVNLKHSQHIPTEEDIALVLKEFTVNFLLKGFNPLISELRPQLLMDSSLDRTHFTWIISYFLKFAVQLGIDLKHIRGVLSFDIISFLTYEGATLCEHFELLKTPQECEVSTSIRKIHITITAIRELLMTINSYKKMKHLDDSDLKYLRDLQRDIAEMEDLRCLFVLFLRQYNPQVHTKNYLRDVIVTNHILLTFIENSGLPNTTNLLQAHMQQFVPVEMMRQYGYLLECFEENGHYVNDCVFTMMHHVAGDLKNVTALFQPMILKTFSVIWEHDFKLCDDWADLIEYVIHKFISIPRSVPSAIETRQKNVTAPSSNKDGWTQEECDCLYWYYVQSASNADPIGSMINLYAEAGIYKTRIGVIEQLLKQDVITGCQYNEFMKREPISNTIKLKKYLEEKRPRDDIELLKDHLLKEEKLGGGFISWLQKVLLETCYAKTFINKERSHIMEPVPLYSTILRDPVPIVAWSFEQKGMMQSQVFLLLLHKLGLHLPAGAGKVFARIPSAWSPEMLYTSAKRLGPIEEDWVKFNTFSIEYFQTIEENPIEERSSSEKST